MIGIIFAALAFEASVQEAKVETECLQEGLTNRCSLVQYSSLVRMSGGNAVWTDALQTALREHEVVVIPPSDRPYDIDRTGDVRAEGDSVHMRQTGCAYGVRLAGEFKVLGDGRVTAGNDGTLKVELHPGPHAGPRPLVRFGTDPLSV